MNLQLRKFISFVIVGTVVLIALIFLNIGCNSANQDSSTVTVLAYPKEMSIELEPSDGYKGTGVHVYKYIIDSCEYIGSLKGYNSDVLSHKGNCKFCTERNNKK